MTSNWGKCVAEGTSGIEQQPMKWEMTPALALCFGFKTEFHYLASSARAEARKEKAQP